MGLVLASLSLLGLGIFGPGIANGIVSGGPQLGAGSAIGTGLSRRAALRRLPWEAPAWRSQAVGTGRRGVWPARSAAVRRIAGATVGAFRAGATVGEAGLSAAGERSQAAVARAGANAADGLARFAAPPQRPRRSLHRRRPRRLRGNRRVSVAGGAAATTCAAASVDTGRRRSARRPGRGECAALPSHPSWRLHCRARQSSPATAAVPEPRSIISEPRE